MPSLAEDRLKELTASLAEYSEESVAAAIEAAKDPDVARQFIAFIESSVEDLSMCDFTEIAMFVALSEAKVPEAAPVLLSAAGKELFNTTVYSDAAIYALQRMGRPGFEEAMRYIGAPAEEDVYEKISAFDVLLAAVDADARLRAEVADFCYARMDLELAAMSSGEANLAYSCGQVLVFFRDERVRPILERCAADNIDLRRLLDEWNEKEESEVATTWRKPWQEMCPEFSKDVAEFAEGLEDGDHEEEEETGLLDEPEIVERRKEFAKLVDEFNASPQAARLMSYPEADRDDLKYLYDFGIDGVSRDFEFTNESQLREYLFKFLPRELLLFEDQILRLIDHLGAFFQFLQATDRLPNAEPLHRLLRKATEDVPRLNEDRNKWGLDKTVRIIALLNGIDLESKEGPAQFGDLLVEGIKKLKLPGRKARDEEAEYVGDETTYERDNTPFRHTAPKVGRNDPCPCGSAKKYKKCCGK